MKYLVTLLCLSVLLLAVGCGEFPYPPESYAAATATIMQANALQTQNAINARAVETTQAGAAQATATIAAISAHGTAVSINQQAQATATAVPYQDRVAATNVVNAYAWSGAVIGAAGIVISIALCVLFLAAMIRMRSRNIPRDWTGQLPGVWVDGALVDPNRMIGPAATVSRPDVVLLFARLVDYLQTGKVAELPEPRILIADGGAYAEQLLDAAKSANQTAAVAALMRPGTSTAEKNARMEMVQKGAMRGPWGEVRPPETRVIANGDDAIRIIAEHLGDRLPKGMFGQGSAIPPPEPPAGYIDAPTGDPVEGAWRETTETTDEKDNMRNEKT